MSAVWWVLGVVYPLMALAVLCAGVFGIATARERINKQIERHTLADGVSYTFAYGWRFFGVAWLGAIWPIAIPVWFAWRKGTLISDELTERARLAKQYGGDAS